MTARSYTCRTCGEVHEAPPFSWGFGEPGGWEVTTDPSSRCWGENHGEQAILHCQDETGYFMLGNLWIPVVDADEDFNFLVWVSLSEENFERAAERWSDPNRTSEPPYFGWLMHQIPGYPSTWHLKINLRTMPPGQRPHVELEPTDHPLAVEQRTGITVDRVIEIAEAVEASLGPGGGG